MKKSTDLGSFPVTKLPRMFITKKNRGLVLLLLFFSLQLGTRAFAQSKMDISVKNATGEEIFRRIRQISNYSFVYDSEAVRTIPNRTLELKDVTIDEIMTRYLQNTNFSYVVENNTVIIRSRGVTRPQQAGRAAVVQLSGLVTDEKSQVIQGVTVSLKSTRHRAVTDANGRYALNIASDAKNPVLVFSAVGMKTEELAYEGNNVMNMTLQGSINQLDDIVVTGVFERPKETYTGAVREISQQDLKQFQGRNIFVTLGNIDPAFYVLPNNNLGSDPNYIPDIQLRGTSSIPNINQLQDQTAAALNTPLVIIDQFETTLQRMMDLNTNDIESITLLKDGQATSLYGSRGANGVIVIKTRQPVSGQLRVTYRGGVNVSLPDLSSYNLLNARDKLELERLSGYYTGRSTQTPQQIIELQEYYNQILAQVASGVNTDWLAKPLRTGIDQNHNLRMEGGDATFRYALSLQHNDIRGVMKESGRRTFNGGVDLSYQYKNLNFRNNLIIGHLKSRQSPYGSFADYARLNPYWSPYDEQGNITQYFTPYNQTYWRQTDRYSDHYPNPLYDATLNTYDIGTTTSIIDNFQIEWRPKQELFFRGGVGVVSNMRTNDYFRPAEHSAFVGYTGQDIFRRGSYIYDNGKDWNYTGNFSANYTKVFANIHRIYASAVVEVAQNQNTNYTFSAEGFPDENIDFLGMALQYQQNGSPTGNEATTRRVGILANANYALKDRYLADFSYRLDGASQFGVNRRFAPFWSAGLGWNMHYESFIHENLPFISRMKLRASYGVAGSTQFSAYQSQAIYQYYMDNRYNNWVGAYQTALGNPNLEWQKTDNTNIGLEVELFNSRLALQGDYYTKNTSNLLSSLELPFSNGFTDYVENIGELKQQGYELTASVWLIRDNQRNISWSVTANMTHLTDRITRLSEAMKAANEQYALQLESSPNRIIREGASQNTIYAVRSLGIDPSTGREVYLDRNGEVTYLWSARDRVAVGLDQPKYRGNFSTLVRYRGFTMNASFSFRFGGQLYNSTLIDKVENADKLFNVDERVFTDRWIQPGDLTFFRGINEVSTIYASSRFVQDENTLILQNVNLNYDVMNRGLLKRWGMQALSISANTGELFYLSSVRQERGLAYPFTRQFSLTLQATF